MTRVIVLDDWQGIAQRSANWSALTARAEVVFRQEPLGDLEQAVEILKDFDVIAAMRERQPFPAALVEQLPRLRMIAMTGGRAATMDLAALTERGVVVSGTGGGGGPATAELTIGLLIAAMRSIPAGDAAIRAGGFQSGVQPGMVLEGRTLGIIGLGRIGRRVAKVANALGMEVLAWSPNLTSAAALEAGAHRVEKAALLAASDAVTLHMVLSACTHGLVSGEDLGRMKSGALLINTSRAGLVDNAALLDAVRTGRLRAALDVYDQEPLPADHPLREAPNTVLTPHIGYGTRDVFAQFYRETVENIIAFLDGAPMRVLAPPG